MATVYQAVHLDTPSGREFAVKVLHEHRARAPEAVQRFLIEARTLSALSHPHIVKVYDFSRTDDRRPYFVMELLEGEMLSGLLIRGGALPLPRTLSILRQLAQALAVVHAQGIVHRDLKPDNVHVGHPRGGPQSVHEGDASENFGVVTLLDFGIAKFPDLPDDPDEALGTPLYMAPEQWCGEPVDTRTDIYGLGVLFYEMLAGQPPFVADTIDDVRDLHLNSPVPSPRLARPELDISETVERLILKALQKDPEQRQQSAEEFLQELAELECCALNRSLPREAR